MPRIDSSLSTRLGPMPQLPSGGVRSHISSSVSCTEPATADGDESPIVTTASATTAIQSRPPHRRIGFPQTLAVTTVAAERMDRSADIVTGQRNIRFQPGT